MGDFKSEMGWFITDEAINQTIAKPDLPSDAVHAFLNGLFFDAEASGQPQLTFNSYSNDQYVYLSLLLRCYENPADAPLHAWQEFDFLQMRFHTQAACRQIVADLRAWQAAFLADPWPACLAIQQELLTFDAEFAPRDLITRVNPDFMRALYARNDGQGYHAAVDSPGSELIGSIPVRTNTLQAINQAFGYISAISGWMRQADEKGLGLVSVIY